MKKTLFGISLLIVVFLVMFFAENFFNPNHPPKVTADNILKITPGMTLEQVSEIIGTPLRVKALYGMHKIGCSKVNPVLDAAVNTKTDIRKLVFYFMENQGYCCEANKEDVENFNHIYLVYTKPRILGSYPMLWVRLDTNFRVDNIYAKEYEGLFFGNDPCIYSLAWAVDSNRKFNYYKTYNTMDKEKFFRCFR
jgi:hypothetical protein